MAPLLLLIETHQNHSKIDSKEADLNARRIGYEKQGVGAIRHLASQFKTVFYQLMQAYANVSCSLKLRASSLSLFRFVSKLNA